MKFSIITITYNCWTSLAKTMESVLSQDYADFEYILIDGGSSDGTVDVIRDHAARDPRIRWVSEPDEGIADAFNKGIALATGDMIGIINSDDTYGAGALRTVADARASHPECDLFHGDMIRFQGDKPLFLLKPQNVATHIWREMPLNHPTTFVTRRAYEKVGRFDVSLKLAMDYDMVLRLHNAGFRFHYIEQVLATMGYGGASDMGFLEGLKEVYAVTVRAGYPRRKAFFWLLCKAGTSSVKNMLRRLGLYSFIRLHPRFRQVPLEK